MWMVLCHNGDDSARWAHQRLAERHPDIELVTVEELASPGTVWDHRVKTAGATVTATLADGRKVGGPAVESVLNRMTCPPAGLLSVAAGADRRYADSELGAFAISWLEALAPVVVNRASVAGCSGPWRSPLAWRSMAARAGLPVTRLTLDSRTPAVGEEFPGCRVVLSIGGHLLDDQAPTHVVGAAQRFTLLAETPVLGLRFAVDAGEWSFLDATPHPDLRIAGSAGIDALEEVLAA